MVVSAAAKAKIEEVEGATEAAAKAATATALLEALDAKLIVLSTLVVVRKHIVGCAHT